MCQALFPELPISSLSTPETPGRCGHCCFLIQPREGSQFPGRRAPGPWFGPGSRTPGCARRSRPAASTGENTISQGARLFRALRELQRMTYLDRRARAVGLEAIEPVEMSGLAPQALREGETWSPLHFGR